MADLAQSLQSFVTYVRTHLTGDEKGESADFLDRLFRAFGHDGIKEAGTTRETRLAKKGGAKGKNYADLLWPERVLGAVMTARDRPSPNSANPVIRITDSTSRGLST